MEANLNAPHRANYTTLHSTHFLHADTLSHAPCGPVPSPLVGCNVVVSPKHKSQPPVRARTGERDTLDKTVQPPLLTSKSNLERKTG